MARRKRLCERAQAARELGIPVRTLDRWVERGAPVGRGKGRRYDVDALRAWQAARASTLTHVRDLTTERARLAAAQRVLTRLKIGEARGSLLRRELVEAEGREVLHALRARLLALPRQAVLTGAIPPAAEPTLRRLITDALRELARWRTVADPGAVVATDQEAHT